MLSFFIKYLHEQTRTSIESLCLLNNTNEIIHVLSKYLFSITNMLSVVDLECVYFLIVTKALRCELYMHNKQDSRKQLKCRHDVYLDHINNIGFLFRHKTNYPVNHMRLKKCLSFIDT